MSKRSTRSSDPGTSVWWLVLPLAGAIVGTVIPLLSALGGVWSVLGSLLGAFVGVVADFTPQVRDWISTRAHNKWIAEVSGDSGPIGKADLNSLLIHRSDRDVDEYVRRDAHEQLHALVKDRIPVLVEGPSMAGKTRLVVEVLREGWPETHILFPKHAEGLEKLLGLRKELFRGAIIFLDDLDRFLNKQEFTLGVLNKWINDSCAVVATTTRTNYHKWRKQQGSKVPGWEIFNRFHALSLEAKLSKHELEAVRNTSYAGDLASIEQLGLGRVLGRAEDIRRRFTSARESHKGRAGLVKAAVDWSRVGLGSASKEALLTLAQAYDDDFWEEPDWEAEWSWVIGETATDAPLVLRTGKDSWEALDLIVEEADWPLTNTTLTTMATCPHTALQALRLVFDMHSRNLLTGDRTTESLVQEAADLLQEDSLTNPTDVNLLIIYAFFLTDIRPDHDLAEEVYEQARKADPNNSMILGNYALFLTTTRQKYDLAEELYNQAITIEPNNAFNLGSYAFFLTNILQRYNRAEEVCKQAIKVDPNNAINLGIYSQLLFVTGRDEKGVEFAERALDFAQQDQEALCAECHFYLFMHSPRHRIASGRALKALLADGITTGDWSFEENLERLRQEEDPRYELAQAVAEALRTGDASALNDFEEWRDLDLPDREE